MASNSEVTYGAKLKNAKDIATNLRSFNDYSPPREEQKAENLEAFINLARAANVDLAGLQAAYSAAVETRQQLYYKDKDSLEKIMSPIAANIRSAYGKDSKEIAVVNAYVIKIRGEQRKKDKKDPTEESVSQSAKSFGSMTENFSSLIATLGKMANYKPAKKELVIAELSNKLQALEQSNLDVTNAFAALKSQREKRNGFFDQLNVLVQGIKNAVIAQYTINSTEYRLIKSLKV